MSQAITLEPSLFPKRWKLGPVSLHVPTATWLILPPKNFTRKTSLVSAGRSVGLSVGRSVGRKPDKCHSKNLTKQISPFSWLVGRSVGGSLGLSSVTMSVGRSVGENFMTSNHRHVGCPSRGKRLECWRCVLRFAFG